MSRVFISYRRDDSAGHAGRLYDRLVAAFGEDEVFMDLNAIEPGLDFGVRVTEAVRTCELFVALIGRNWLGIADANGRRRLDDPSDLLRTELVAALRRPDLRVIPVLVEGAKMPRAEVLPTELKALARRNALELNDRRWRDGVDELIELAERILRRPDRPPASLASAVRLGPPAIQASAGVAEPHPRSPHVSNVSTSMVFPPSGLPTEKSHSPHRLPTRPAQPLVMSKLVPLGIVVAALTAAIVLALGDPGDGTTDGSRTKSTTTIRSRNIRDMFVSLDLSHKPTVTRPADAPPDVLYVRDIVRGSGPPVRNGDHLTTRYVGVSYSTGEELTSNWGAVAPFGFTLGKGYVIKGWDRGLAGMRVGGRRMLVVPPALAYGRAGSGSIPSNATLIYIVDLKRDV